MPHSRPASAEEFSVFTASSHLPASLNHVSQKHTPCDLTQPSGAVFPSPNFNEFGTPTPRTKASKAIDAFPFPLQPSLITPPASPSRTFHDPVRSPKHRCISTLSPYPTPPASPDRYIPARRSPDSLTKSFRLSKSPSQLSGSERLLRQNSPSLDPFSARSPRRVGATRVALEPDGSLPNPHRPGLLGGGRDVIPGEHNRAVSTGAVWNLGGTAAPDPGPIAAVPDGRGGLLGSGTNAPMFSSQFFKSESEDQMLKRFEGRVAAALDVDQSCRTLNSPQTLQGNPCTKSKTVWKDSRWTSDDEPLRKVRKPNPRAVPSTPFRVLDAPQLRDDFYCSVLAYCHTSQTLAVGLNDRVYLWSEEKGVQYARPEEHRRNNHVTSLSFSSTQGGHSILAIGRHDGQVSLWSLFDEGDRFQSQQPNGVACLAFKPVTTRRPSERLGVTVSTEELLVGDETGVVYYYSIEWMTDDQVDEHRWQGTMHLMAKISVHTQQICGLAWSLDGDYFATGGNDNACCLFEAEDVLTPPAGVPAGGSLQALINGFGTVPTFVPNAASHQTLGSMLGGTEFPVFGASSPGGLRAARPIYVPGRSGILLQIGEGRQKHKWTHSAAVKAIAFCPWQRGLLATGGGSNDRAIHFYHAFSGACLATINVQAQVTSLIWSTTRREIAATFGYAQPEHPYRIAVFSWPDCRQVVAIPWADEMRALYAIPYPGGPNETTRRRGEGGRWWSRTAKEGCIVVASSDESVKFHEVWSDARKSVGGLGRPGLLGGSDILEGMEGTEKEGREVIR